MRSRGVSLLVLAACGFRSPAGPIDRLDAAVPIDAAAPIDAPPAAAAAPFCDPTDPHLVACYEFEGDSKDGSSHHLDATTTAVTFASGQVGQASKLICSTGGGPVATSGTTSLAAGRWSHVACIYDGTTTIVYVDGSEVARMGGGGVPSKAGNTGMSIAADNPRRAVPPGCRSPPTTRATAIG
jgi:hypothetical protein